MISEDSCNPLKRKFDYLAECFYIDCRKKVKRVVIQKEDCQFTQYPTTESKKADMYIQSLKKHLPQEEKSGIEIERTDRVDRDVKIR